MYTYSIADIGIGVMALVFLSIGLYRGISGELASALGLIGAIVFGFFLYPQAALLAQRTGCSPSILPICTGAINLGFGIVIYALIRVLVNKFVSMCIPQPTNALLGMAIGLAKAIGITVALIWFNVIGINEHVFLEIKSPILCRVAEMVVQYSGSIGELQ
jgi:uncharacterized membrane protein required for colicin V production